VKILILCLSCAAGIAAASSGWNRYEPIVSRSPFAKECPLPVVEEPIKNPDGAFGKLYRLCMLYRDSEGRARAGIVSKATDKNLLLTLGQEAGGVTLVDVEMECGTALLKQGEEFARVKLEELDIPSMPSDARATSAAAAAPSAVTRPARTVRRTGSAVPEHIREGLRSSKPKKPRFVVATDRSPDLADMDDQGGGHRSRGSRTGAESATGGNPGKETARAASPKHSSAGYVVQSVPGQKARKLLAQGF
jgi:hypothetical protein